MFYDTSHSLTVSGTVLAEWGSSHHRFLFSEAAVNTSCMYWHVLFSSLNLILGQKFFFSCCQMKLFSVSLNTIPHLNTISLTQPKEVTIVHCLLLSGWFLDLVYAYVCSRKREREDRPYNNNDPGL